MLGECQARRGAHETNVRNGSFTPAHFRTDAGVWRLPRLPVATLAFPWCFKWGETMIGNMSQVIAVSAILGFASFAAWGQAAGNVPRFEVASVKPSVPAADGRRPMSIVRDPGRIDYKNIHLLTLLYEAYGVREDQVIGPPEFNRSEERRVGKECRSRWSPY